MIFCFLSNKENLNTIHHNSDLLYDIYNTINEHNRRLTHCLLSAWYLYFKKFKSLFHNFIYFIINHCFYVKNFWMHYTLFIIIFIRNKINTIAYLVQDGEGNKPPSSTSFSRVTFKNVEIIPKNFLTFTFHPFSTLM